ncbi:UNVERIFIED_CONTAM: uncharacterized protein YrrD [Acetivibrio alkalicellulosi]
MERYSEVLGLPIICADNGNKAGIIKDIVFCPKEKKIAGFEIECYSYQIKKKFVMKEDVLSLGKDALIIDNLKVIKDLKKVKDVPLIKERGSVIGLKIYTRYGEDVGVVRDVLFDFQKGIVEGVEVSDGLIQDIVKGRSLLTLLGKVEFGEESILVEKAAVEEMIETGKGIKSIIKDI